MFNTSAILFVENLVHLEALAEVLLGTRFLFVLWLVIYGRLPCFDVLQLTLDLRVVANEEGDSLNTFKHDRINKHDFFVLLWRQEQQLFSVDGFPPAPLLLSDSQTAQLTFSCGLRPSF
jgi:hypothetical protein